MYSLSSVMSSYKIMVKVLIVISILVAAKGEKGECDGNSAIIRGRCYDKEVIIDGIHKPYDLAVDFHRNVLYFTNVTGPHGETSAYYLDLDTKKVVANIQVPIVTAYAVDQVRHQAYIGGSKGIYKFHYNNNTAELIEVNHDFIRSMLYKEELYYTNIYTQVYTLKNGDPFEVKDLIGKRVEVLAIDEEGYRLFQNYSGLYGKKIHSDHVDVLRSGRFMGMMATDVSGVPYLCEYSHVYSVNDRKTLENIGELNDQCIFLTFDKDNNIIYCNLSQIIRLKLKAEN